MVDKRIEDLRNGARLPLVDRFAAYREAIDDGYLTSDEVRSLEGLPPLNPRRK